MEASTTKEYEDVVRSTAGAVFLGTPFQGTDKVLHEATVLRIQAAIKNNQASNAELGTLLDDAPNDHHDLQEIVHKLRKLLNNPEYKFPYESFAEDQPTNISSILARLREVPQWSDEKLNVDPSGSILVGGFFLSTMS